MVIDDILGIEGDLDAAMASHFENYTDEWRATLEDPEKLRRFVLFVNAPDEVDEDLAHIRERCRTRPANRHESSGSVQINGPEAGGALR